MTFDDVHDGDTEGYDNADVDDVGHDDDDDDHDEDDDADDDVK